MTKRYRPKEGFGHLSPRNNASGPLGASASVTLADAIFQTVKAEGAGIFFAEPVASDLIAVPVDLAIVDRELLGPGEWEIYCDYLKEVNTPAVCSLGDDGTTTNGSSRDDTPLIIVDSGSPKPGKTSPSPLKAPGTVFHIDEWSDNLIALLTRTVLRGEPLNIERAVNEVNAQRLKGWAR